MILRAPFLLSLALSVFGLPVSANAAAETPVAPSSAPTTWMADNGDGTFTNPLFYDEFSDPDLIRVGEDYYLTGTTMHTMPGLPILHSRDLVNWDLLGYALDQLDLGPAYRLESGQAVYGQGIWAPSFRYHEGTFHIFTNVNHQTTQHLTATNPAGPWTRTAMKCSLHDLSVLFDDDGHAYAIWGYREIRFARLTDDLTDIVPSTERVLIPADAGIGEGAHFYKFKGRYFITSSNYDPVGYMACARADHLTGPYEVTTISARETLGTGNGWRLEGMGWGPPGVFKLQPPQPAQMGAIPMHQGGIVDTPTGEWWGFSMTDHNAVGRLTALSPVTWQDGWPYFGLPGNLLRTPRTWVKPNTGHTEPPHAPYQRNDSFDGPALANVWQWNHVPDPTAWSLTARPGFLRLAARPATDFWFARNTLTQRAVGPASVATAVVDASGLTAGDVGGLALLNYPYAWLGLSPAADGSLTLSTFDQKDGTSSTVTLAAPRVWLRATCDFDTEQAQFAYSTDGATFTPLGAPVTLVFQLKTFQGVRYGLFSYNRAGAPGGHLDVDAFTLDEPQAARTVPIGQIITLTSRTDGSRLATWHGRLRLVPTDSAEAASPAARFRVIDRGLGRVALEATDGSGMVTVTGVGGPADVKLLPTVDPVRSVFQWQHMLQGDTMLLSLATNRYLTASATDGGLASADAPGATSDRRGGACFTYEVQPPAPVQTHLALFDLADVRLLDGPFLNAQEVDRRYLLDLDVDRLLAGFRLEAGLEPKAAKYPNWESSGLDGHTLGHYLTAAAQMAIVTGDAELRRRLDYAVAELAACQQANGNGYVGAVPHSRELWTKIAAGGFGAQGFSLGGAWVPWYNVHKTFAGLRDAWHLTHNTQARDVLIHLADWCGTLLDGLTDEQVEAMMRAEHGGMAEVLADVFAITNNPRYLHLAQRFSHHALLDPLLRHEDKLTGLHANTQIPKVIGFARIAELGGAPTWDDAARFFWDTVVRTRSVAFGGNSLREHFNAPDDFEPMLESREGPESCNTFNMLRLTEALFRRDGATRYADYYERALFNHILSTQHPEHGGFVYFTPLRPRHYRVYSQPDQCFWCCVGSGLENHGKYGEFIYAADDTGGLWVNLFIASELNWKTRAINVRQETRFPDESGTHLTLQLAQPQTFALHLRRPGWAASNAFEVRVNGQVVETQAPAGSYVSVEREWHDGDRVDVALPMQTTLEPLPGDADYAAVMYGPILLAAKTGTDDLDGLIANDGRMAHVAPGPFRPLDSAPMLVGDRLTLTDHIVRLPGESLRFSAHDLIRPADDVDLELEPFFRVHDARYMMYWRVTDDAGYAQVVTELHASEQARLDLDRRTVDLVLPGEQQPEVEHKFAGGDSNTGNQFGRSWRDARDWFGYDLHVEGDDALALQLTYWGNAWRAEAFTVEVNGTPLGTVSVPGNEGEAFIVHTVTIPAEFVRTASASTLHVVFRAADGSERVTPLYEVRLVRPE